MSRSVVERVLSAAYALLSVACTQPSFAPDEGNSTDANVITDDAASTLDASAVLRSDSSVVGASDASEPTTSKGDAAPSATQDAALAHEASLPSGAAGDAGAEGGANVVLDAGVPTTPDGAEAGTPITPDPVPSWAKPLLGQFAKRSIYYAYDTEVGIVTVTIDISLLSISANAAGELSMQTQQCAFSVHWENGGASLTLVKPQSIAPTTSKLSLGQAPHFSSDTVAQVMGYDPARSSRCNPGASYATKFPDQTWISSSSCSCSPTAAVLPFSSSDCRVIDQDGDGRAGVGMKGADLAFNQSVALTNTLKISAGEVRADGEHVLHEQRTRNAACLLGCTSINEALCPGGETLVRPLPANATCAAALDKVNVLPIPTAPRTDCGKNP